MRVLARSGLGRGQNRLLRREERKDVSGFVVRGRSAVQRDHLRRAVRCIPFNLDSQLVHFRSQFVISYSSQPGKPSVKKGSPSNLCHVLTMFIL